MADESGSSSSRWRETSALRGAVVIGVITTVAVAAAELIGLVAPAERLLVDQRHQWFASFTPEPSDRIVHIDIDDKSLRTVGRWPWPRRKLAEVVDELRRAGAKVIAFDLLLDDPQPPTFVPVSRSEESRDEGEAPPLWLSRSVDEDQLLAEALRRAGNVLVPVNVVLREASETRGWYERAVEQLRDDVAANEASVIEALGGEEDEAEFVRANLPSLRLEAMRRALHAAMAELPAMDFAAAREALLPDLPDELSDSPLLTLLRQAYDGVRAERIVAGLVIEARGGRNETHTRTTLTAPIPALAEAAAVTGSVAYDEDADGAVRSVPLWHEHQGRWYPHFALATACAYLDLPLDSLRIRDAATVIPVGDAFRLPHLTARWSDGWRMPKRRLAVTWPSNAKTWDRLFDPDGRAGVQHVPVGWIAETAEAAQKIAHNHQAADAYLVNIVDSARGTMLERVLPGEWADALRDIDGQAERQASRQRVVDAAKQIIAQIPADAGASDPAMGKLRAFLVEQLAGYEQAGKAAEAGQRLLDAARTRLRDQVGERICLIGWTATGALADFLPTSLHAKSPGVVVHGAVVNAILTQHFLVRCPLWVDVLIVLGIGVLASVIAARFAPISALAINVVLGGAFFALNGYVMFDWANVQVAAASPLTSIGLAWAAITVYRLIVEQRQRQRITRQFKNYVSPDLVQLLVDNPSRIKTGRHELTCMFSDIAGFTTISEKLGPEQTIALLNDYLRLMTNRIMAGRGTVNKYLGDGIMAFWGAPLDDENHAISCCRAMLGCINELNRLGDEPRFADLPRLHMRVGIATGQMMVGDCGAPPDRSDYTVIGDTVNLSSRLEGANKQLGTQILMSVRTNYVVQDYMLTRVIGRIFVVGRGTYEQVHELVNTYEQATDDQRELAEMTTDAVDAYIAAEFDECMELFDEIGRRFGQEQLVDIYRRHCKMHMEHGTTREDGFDGTIELPQK